MSARPLRLCWLADAASRHTRRWAAYLSGRGHQVEVISLRPREIPGVRVHVLSGWRGLGKAGYPLHAPRVRALLRRSRPDLVHAHHVTSYGLLGALSGFHPLLVHTWGRDVLEFPQRSLLYRGLVTFNLRRADAITATSHAMADAARSALRQPVPTAVVPFGVDLARFDLGLRQQRRAAEGFVVGVVKSLEPVYGLDDLLRAVALARRQQPKLRALIVGQGSQRERLERLARELGIAGAVEFTGPVPSEEIARLLARMDLFVLPSHTEGFGVSAVEAAAMGLPVVASDVGGLPEVVIDGETGFLTPPRSPEALAERIVQLAGDAELRARLGRAGRARVAECFDWAKNAGRMEAFYYEVLGL